MIRQVHDIQFDLRVAELRIRAATACLTPQSHYYAWAFRTLKHVTDQRAALKQELIATIYHNNSSTLKTQ